MTEETITTAGGATFTRLTAADGCYLTQAATDTDILTRIFCQTVALAATQSADYWQEIDSDTYALLKAEQEAAQETAQDTETQETTE